MDDKLLIQKCQRGERKAQRLLYDNYYLYLYGIVLRYVISHHDTEDVVSEVFVRIFKNINKLTTSKNQGLKRWIKTIAINEAVRFIKKKDRLVFTDSEDNFEHVEATESPLDEPNVAIIKKIIKEMPIGYRTIFLMNAVEGLSHSEIAEYLGISRNTSKSQMLKARKYIQCKLKKNESRQIR